MSRLPTPEPPETPTSVEGLPGEDPFGPYGPGGDMLLPSEREAQRWRDRSERNPGRRVASRAGKAVATRVSDLFGAGGPAFRTLANAHAASTAGDTLVAIALANTLFFSVPSSEARGNVALYLLITIAPFAVIGPLLGWVMDRPGAERFSLIAASLLRLVAAAGLVLLAETFWLFPLAFLLMVLSRVHGIARSALLPQALENAVALVTANARLAQVGVLAGGVVAPIGAGLALAGPGAVLVGATALFGVAVWQSIVLPDVGRAADALAAIPPDQRGTALLDGTLPLPGMEEEPAAEPEPPEPAVDEDREAQLRLARLATAVVRLLNGFLVLVLAFAFRDVDAPLADFGAVLGAAGGGYSLASFAAPRLEKTLREEPMVVAALAVEAAAAFVAGHFFGLPAAVALALAAGYAWGTAKFAFDGLLQATVSPSLRGRAFTKSETIFQLAWVLGAIIPTALVIDIRIGLVIAGIVALVAQTIYVSRLLQRV